MSTDHPGAARDSVHERDYSEHPLVVTWEVTQACQLACDHCRADAQPGRHPDELTTAEGKQLIDQIEDFGSPSPVLVFSGGDPLERLDFFDLMEYASASTLRTGVTPAPTANLDQTMLERFADADIDRVALTSWHRHPRYVRLRTENINSFVRRQDFSLADETTELVFAAHGTPQHYIESGSEYEEYVREWCETVSNRLGVSTYTLGYQNHDSRDVEWTEPAIEDSLADIDAERLVIEPISFMHEQSETLCDLDIELRDETIDAGFEFHRVPIPYDNPEFPVVLADLVEPFVADIDPSEYGLQELSNDESIDAFCL
ncbi:ferrochelatase [Halovenus sp. HT40]|uniref:ferrochelatase n=1 Tax=Halovenus sp. HT40 TaxID=3126691 RepID=UPI00300F01F0